MFFSKKRILFIVNHSVCRRHTTLRIGNTREDTVRRHTCCLSRASGVMVVVSGPCIDSMVFRLARSWWLCSSSFWLRPFVALTLVEVFAAVPLGVSCFLSCRVGRYFVARGNVGAQAGCFIAAFGHRRPPRHARTSRVLVVGSQWHGCKCS